MKEEEKEITAEVQDLPKHNEWWMLVGKYNEDDIDWYGTSTLNRHKIDAEAQLQIWKFKVHKLVKIVLPV